MQYIAVENLPCADLRAGDMIALSGTIYTARDAAHVRLIAMSAQNETLPFELKGSVVYYAGPTPTPPGKIIGSCGPTTAERMDAFTPQLLREGLVATIGKGSRSQAVVDAMKETGSFYLCAVGGAGALMAQCVTACEVIAFEDLGCEAIRRLTVKDMPLIVGVDKFGKSVFNE
ncbi:MAG: FumA C-terminus/TtdB family hydratase beta subunit [Oscillospiraceae bacterium]|nr:FumA C-terminus/TtdB family hydratase beta subunit [Oscillospiraceae bacterium]